MPDKKAGTPYKINNNGFSNSNFLNNTQTKIVSIRQIKNVHTNSFISLAYVFAFLGPLFFFE